jgi:hypothetical protein
MSTDVEISESQTQLGSKEASKPGAVMVKELPGSAWPKAKDRACQSCEQESVLCDTSSLVSSWQ